MTVHDDYIEVMRRKYSCVWIAVAGDAEHQIGVTLTSVFSVAVLPVVCGFVLEQDGYFTSRVEVGSAIALSMLSIEDVELADRFAGRAHPAYDFAGRKVSRLANGLLIATGSSAILSGTVDNISRMHGRAIILVLVDMVIKCDNHSPLHRRGGIYVASATVLGRSALGESHRILWE